jgi:cytochrome oxidase assembly protein ShyY1
MRRFRFNTIPFIATVLLVAFGIALGNWQTRRGDDKAALQARLLERGKAPAIALTGAPADPDALEFRHVAVTGRFLPDWPLWLDNRPNGGRFGMILLMPFTISGSDKVVLVERGWVPRGAEHDRVPRVATPAGEVRIEGIAVRRPGRVMRLGEAPPLKPGAFVQNLEPAEFARATGMDVQQVVVEQTGPDPVLVRDWQGPDVDVARHRGYAFQWYALAAMAFLFFVITGFRSASKQAA